MKPILFNSDMVRAILDGRKTVTRRVIKPQPILEGRFWKLRDFYWPDTSDEFHPSPLHPIWDRAPYRYDDFLYVRETWAIPYGKGYYYAADYPSDFDILAADNGDVSVSKNMIRWHPSIHMPKAAARIFLCVTDVRIERLQSIKTWQCVDEGAVKKPNYTKRHDLVCHDRYRTEFAKLWDSTVKPADLPLYGWEANPWVWVISFKRCEKPEE